MICLGTRLIRSEPVNTNIVNLTRPRIIYEINSEHVCRVSTLGWGGKRHPRCAQHHLMSLRPWLNEKEKMIWEPALISICFLTTDAVRHQLPHAPTITMSPWCHHELHRRKIWASFFKRKTKNPSFLKKKKKERRKEMVKKGKGNPDPAWDTQSEMFPNLLLVFNVNVIHLFACLQSLSFLTKLPEFQFIVFNAAPAITTAF